MFEGLFQPLHMLVILMIVLIISAPQSFLKWAKGREKVSRLLRKH